MGNGSAANGSYDMQFELFDDPIAGAQQGSTVCSDNVPVTNGLFTIQIDFGVSVFNGADRWLQIGVRADSTVGNCGSGAYTNLSPRQPLTASPYAIQTRGIFVDPALNVGLGTTNPGAKLDVNGTAQVTGLNLTTGAAVGRVLTSDASGTGTWQAPAGGGLILPFSGSMGFAGNAFAVSNSNSSGTGVYGGHTASTGTTPGVYGETLSTAASAFGLQGVVTPASPGDSSTGVRGINNGTGGLGIGVWGSQNGTGFGVEGSVSGAGLGVVGFTGASGTGVAGFGGDVGVSGSGVTRGVNGTATSGSARVYGVEGSVSTTANSAAGVHGINSANSGLNFGVLGEASNTTGGGFSAGVRGINASTGGGGIGVWGSQNGAGWGGYFTVSGVGIGVNASSGTGGTGVYASAGSRGVNAFANDPTGVVYAVEGTVNSSTAEAAGVHGVNNNAVSQAYGVLGEIASTSPGGSSSGVRGKNAGTGGLGIGVWGSHNGSGWGVEGSVSGAGVGVIGFGGTGTAVEAVGNFIATGTKSFRIDHPLDPENKYLQHYCTEGPEPINAYRGTVVTDANGDARVTLPDYFEEINRDPNIQLTVVDDHDFALVRVAGEVAENRFPIKTSRPNVKVFWRVEAVRNDLWARSRGTPVEIEKPEQERGTYQHPELYGLAPERGMQYHHEQGTTAQGTL
jgi:hypothetical protein